MNTADRRAEIINILLVRRRITAKELADEFNVTVRTIQNDIQALPPFCKFSNLIVKNEPEKNFHIKTGFFQQPLLTQSTQLIPK